MQLSNRRIAIICAHPDDEVIGLGGQLHLFRDAILIHATDGAPRDLRDAHANGFRTREEYARQRRRELLAALRIAGLGEERTRQLGVVDQEASLDLVDLTRRVKAALDECRPEVVITHPYEGGHQDHDATAFAVHLALERMRSRFELMEFAGYHAAGDGIAAGEFLPLGDSPVATVPLSKEARIQKRRMLDCFVTQQETLSLFRVDPERLRRAPHYDFSRPPHAGPLYYDRYPWGLRSDEWQARAASALRILTRGSRAA
jgi:LmbE family N-acetylglucosaminyl deacetylase